MAGTLISIHRHPVKGFTPESLAAAALTAGEGLAHDRIYAVEDGPSGFDPAAPGHISKQKFTVLAKIPAVAKARTRFEDETHVLHVSAEGAAPLSACLREAEGRAAFAAWLADFLGPLARGPLRVLPAPGAHRFYDAVGGALSVINLASVRDLEQRIGRTIDPLRFRANLYVDGWPAWAEMQARELAIGAAAARVFRPIPRCAATHVDPQSGAADLDLVPALYAEYGHNFCGVYVHVARGAPIRPGEDAAIAA